MLKFTLDTTKVTAKLTDVMAALEDFSEPFNVAGEQLVTYFGQQVFDAQGVDDNLWASWALRTAMMRMKRQGYYKLPPEREDQILVWTGELHRSFDKIVNPKMLTIFNTDPVFAYHQLGTDKMPQRKMLSVNAEVVSLVYRAIYEYITPIWSR